MDLAQQFSRRARKTAESRNSGKRYGENELFVNSGSTLLNLALSDEVYGGWLTGHGVHLVGDSNTGKSMAAITALACAAHDPVFDDHELIDNDREQAREFDTEHLFGTKTKERIITPEWTETVEDWRNQLLKWLHGDKKFIYVMDSFDALSSRGEQEAVQAEMQGKKKGSMGAEKAKGSSQLWRMITGKLKKTSSMLILVSQTRENMNPQTYSAGMNKHFSGGQALRFYGNQRIFLAVVNQIKKKNRVIGVQVKVKVDRTRLTGKKREVEFPIYYDYGIDDIGSMVDFLTIQSKEDDGYWEQKKQTIDAKDLGIEATRSRLIKAIEKEGLEDELRKLTGELWHDIEDSLKLDRKRKFPS